MFAVDKLNMYIYNEIHMLKPSRSITALDRIEGLKGGGGLIGPPLCR